MRDLIYREVLAYVPLWSLPREGVFGGVEFDQEGSVT